MRELTFTVDRFQGRLVFRYSPSEYCHIPEEDIEYFTPIIGVEIAVGVCIPNPENGSPYVSDVWFPDDGEPLTAEIDDSRCELEQCAIAITEDEMADGVYP